jgi:nucleotide-binding universal stress UspA family protein
LAHATGEEVTAVHTFTPSYAEVSPESYNVLRAEAEQHLVGSSAALAEAGSRDTVKTLFVGGDPDAPLAVAARHADLLVVGTRGAGGFAHVHLDTIAHHLAHYTSVPLAIVPTGAADDRVARIVVGVDGSLESPAGVAFCATLAPLLGATVVAAYGRAEGRVGTRNRPGELAPLRRDPGTRFGHPDRRRWSPGGLRCRPRHPPR